MLSRLRNTPCVEENLVALAFTGGSRKVKVVHGVAALVLGQGSDKGLVSGLGVCLVAGRRGRVDDDLLHVIAELVDDVLVLFLELEVVEDLNALVVNGHTGRLGSWSTRCQKGQGVGAKQAKGGKGGSRGEARCQLRV